MFYPLTSASVTRSSTTAINLRRLCTLRFIAIAGQGLAIGIATRWLHMDLPLMPLLGVITSLVILNLATLVRLRSKHPVSEFELFAHFLLDVAALTALLYWSGGSTNPFVVLYLLPLALTASALPSSYTWAMAAITITCYTLLLYWHVPLPHVEQTHTDFGLHVFGMWIGFVVSAVLLSGFAARMATTVRSRDRLAAEMRERELRQERVLALGTLAAGTAHELSTPLSTLAVLFKDFRPGRSLSAGKLATVRTQIARCKKILRSLSASAGAARAEGGSNQPLDIWLEGIVRRWQAVRPDVRVRMHFNGSRPAPHLVTEQTLSQAITNLINNAADASPENVEIEGYWDEERLVLEVADRGSGLTPEIEAVVGEICVTTKHPDRGLGLGLFLAYTTLSRFGGTVRLIRRQGGGTLCRLDLPLTSIKLAA